MSPLIKKLPIRTVYRYVCVYVHLFTCIRVFLSLLARIQIEMHTYMPRRENTHCLPSQGILFLKVAKVYRHYSGIVFLRSWPHAAIAQLAARRSHSPKVVSSILTRRICLTSFLLVLNAFPIIYVSLIFISCS